MVKECCKPYVKREGESIQDHHIRKWKTCNASQRIKDRMREVLFEKGWIDAHGNKILPQPEQSEE